MRQHRSLHGTTAVTGPYIYDDAVWIPVESEAFRTAWIRQQDAHLFDVICQTDEQSAACVVLSGRGISEARRELRARMKKSQRGR